MNRPYEIIEGQIVENKFSYEMIVNHLENSKHTPSSIKFNDADGMYIRTEKCSCGAEFVRADALIGHCGDCFDKFDNLKEYLHVMDRNKRMNK